MKSRLQLSFAQQAGGFTLGKLILLAVVLGGLVAVSKALAPPTGDAESSVHIYNGLDTELTYHVVLSGSDWRTESKTLTFADAASHRLIHPGEYEVVIESPARVPNRKLGFDIPHKDDEKIDIAFNIGHDGTFYLVPVFYLPEEMSKDESEKKMKEYERANRLYKYDQGRSNFKLPRRVDFGFDEGVPVKKGVSEDDNIMTSIATMIASIVAPGREMDPNQEVFYVMATTKRYYDIMNLNKR